MKRLLIIIVTFVITFVLLYFIGDIIFGKNPSPNSLQAAVTFAGINFLALFIYFILAIITTTIVYFSVFHQRLKKEG